MNFFKSPWTLQPDHCPSESARFPRILSGCSLPVWSTMDPSGLLPPVSSMTNRQELGVFEMLFQIFHIGSFHGENGIMRTETRGYFFFQSTFHSGFNFTLNEKSAYCQAEIRCRIHPKQEPGILIIVLFGLTDLKAFFSIFILKWNTGVKFDDNALVTSSF